MTNPNQARDLWMRAKHRAKPAQSKRCGVVLLELAISLALFGVMGAAVTQLLVARAQAERNLETQARRIQQGHHLLERLIALPNEGLTPDSAGTVVENLTRQPLTDPYLQQSDGLWSVQLVQLTAPLPGVQLVVRYRPSSDDPTSQNPIQLEAWRYHHSSVREVPDP